MELGTNFTAMCWATMPQYYVVQSKDELIGMMQLTEMYTCPEYMEDLSGMLVHVARIDKELAQCRFDALNYMLTATDYNELLAVMQPFITSQKFNHGELLEVCESMEYLRNDVRNDVQVMMHRNGVPTMSMGKIVKELFIGNPTFTIKRRNINGIINYYLEVIPALFKFNKRGMRK